MTLHRRLGLAVGVGFANVLPPAFAGALAVQVMTDLSMGPAAFGAAISAFFLLNAAVSPLVGGVVDQLGVRRGVALGAGITAACMVAVAVVARDAPTLIVVLTLGGLGTAFGGPTASLLLADGFPPKRRAFAFGMKQAAIPGAGAVAGFLVPSLAAVIGWRATFGVGGVAAAFVAVASRSVPRHSVRPRRELAERATGSAGLWVLALAFFLAATAAMALTSFLVDHAVRAGLSEVMGGLVLGAGSLAAIVVRLVAGWSVRPDGRDPLVFAIGLLVAGAFGYALLAFGGSGGGAVLAGAVLALGGGWGWTGLLTYAVTVANPDGPAAATGVIQTGGASGGVVGPVLAGWIVSTSSYTVVWRLAAIACLLAAGSLWWFVRGSSGRSAARHELHQRTR